MANALNIARIVVLATVALFGLLALAMGGALMSNTPTDTFVNIQPPYAALAIAVGVFTLLSLPAMIILELVKPSVATSMIAIEVPWLGLLSILWLASGALAASQLDWYSAAQFDITCSSGGREEDVIGDSEDVDPTGAFTSFCAESRAIAAFGFLCWLILMFYASTLIVLAVIASSRKHPRVWTSSVRDAPLFKPAEKEPIPRSYAQYPNVQQSTGGTAYAGTVQV